MTAERWQRVQLVFHDALSKDVADRAAFLADACKGDAELRQEVESLLAEEAPAGSFLHEPALHAAARMMAGPENESVIRTLSPHDRLGPYEILALAGAGGMGEVYEARDTRLDRSVAVKVLPASFVAEPERRARFQREAKTIAALDHPHICTLYDVGEYLTPAGGAALYLVMEHLDGETLAARLRRGPLPLEQALTVAAEIADALATAHLQGVIHRDLKPGNVMLTRSGAKLLDFGLAKLTGHGEQPAAQLVSTAAQPETLTARGTIVGTLQYMAPEQVEGKPADARTDVWAFGAILYEMLTGKRAFEAASSANLIAAILEREPPAVSTHQPAVPPALDRLVRQCLAKLPEDRPDTAHGVAIDLRWIRETSSAPAARRTSPRRIAALAFAATTVSLLAIGAAAWFLRAAPPRPPVARLSVPVGPADTLNAGGGRLAFQPTPGGSRTALTWTPDGQALVFVGQRSGVQQLYVRRLGAAEAQPLAGTAGAQVPAVSPDGRWVAFWADGAIRKVPVLGGPVLEVVPPATAARFTGGAPIPPSGLAWDTRGVLFGGNVYGPIWMVPAQGPPSAVSRLREGEGAHGLPWPLPGGRALLYTVRTRDRTWGGEEVVVQTLATGERKTVIRDAADARYLPTGHLLFLRRGVLFAVAFDVDRLQVVGNEEPVLDGVAQAIASSSSREITGAGQFAVSATGTLAYLPSGSVPPFPESSLVVVDRHGRVAHLPAPRRSYDGGVHLSRDGRRIAVTIRTLNEIGVWMYDLDRGDLRPLASGGEADWPAWAPDGKQVAFWWFDKGRHGLAVQSADGDGSNPPHLLSLTDMQPSSWAPDGRTVVGVLINGWDLGIAAVKGGNATVSPLLRTSSVEQWPTFSPDGRWLAYGSNASGRDEVYVRPYPGFDRAYAVSIDGGASPAWNPNGRELFFVAPRDASGTRRMMAVDFTPASHGPGPAVRPRIGRPRALFEFDPRSLAFTSSPVRAYDVSPSGQRFYTTEGRLPLPPPVVTHVSLIQNWCEELQTKIPGSR